MSTPTSSYRRAFLLHTQKRGLGRFAFFERRQAGDFILDDPRFTGAPILVTGANFGCGSSREQAPWALADLGIRVIIAPGFAEIFRANCVRNGILSAVVDGTAWREVLHAAEIGTVLTVDLATQTIGLSDETTIAFSCPGADRDALLGGYDEIDQMLAYADATARFEARQRVAQPWLWNREPIDG